MTKRHYDASYRHAQYIKNKEHELRVNKLWRENNPEYFKSEKYKTLQRAYVARNHERIKSRMSDYYKKNKTMMLKRNRVYMKKNPWLSVYGSIYARCNLPSQTGYLFYGARGIKNFLSTDDVKMLWIRDGAANMKKPSIDRIDSNGDYTIENCRFIELSENIRRAHAGKKNVGVSVRAEIEKKQKPFYDFVRSAGLYYRLVELSGLEAKLEAK